MISIQITNKKQNQRFEHSKGPLEFGRGPRRQFERFVVNDIFVSRDQLRVEETERGKAVLQNLSLKQPIVISDGSTLTTGDAREIELPVRVALGETTIEIDPVPDEAIIHQTLLTIPQPLGNVESTILFKPLKDLGDAPDPSTLARWVETVIALQRSAAGSPDFYDRTAQALVTLVGLDLGMVLLRQDWTWNIGGSFPPDYKSNTPFSRTLLSHAVSERRTFYQDLETWRAKAESLQGIDAVVVSPIFDQKDEVIGALYGSRGQRLHGTVAGIKPLEAQMVQLLATAVGANLSRSLAIRKRVQFEQFFAPELVRELERDPTLLDERTEDVSVLVCSLNTPANLIDKLGPKLTSRLIREAMEKLSDRIVEHAGVIVNYEGAGVVAMWNAPLRQEDHVLQACGTALAMLGELSELNEKWEEKVGDKLELGIGIDVGSALVGAMGSGHKFQYGPFGPVVATARCVQEATRKLTCPVLITGPARDRLPEVIATRRLCQVRGGGLPAPVDLYELHGVTGSRDWMVRRDVYESALMLYETSQWSKALQALKRLAELAEHKDRADVPTLRLMKRVKEYADHPPQVFEPAFDLDGL